jgi:phenylalanyl-tRNA synthetase beta chain
MKITYKWLKDYVDFPWEWPELVERLTMAGLEREGVEDLAARLKGVVVGTVVDRQQHPNADRLSVCQVDTGEEEPRTIVCGAPNVAAGQKVAVILPGSVLPDGSVIKKTKLRGVESSGMICSEIELGLGEDADGIMVLPDAWEAGTPFATAAGLDDVMLDFEVTPNRPDCLSLIGIAREVSALTGNPLRLPNADLEETGPPCEATVDIQAEDGCPRYVARVIRAVKVGPSPAWLQSRLKAVGQRPINNIVDVTNFVMLESGQPLHAFDLKKISGQNIVVRRANLDEKIETLDGIERPLQPLDLVIADADRAVALAGIMGGADSEVDGDTCDILLESAYFNATDIRRTASRLGMHTDASMRFERGADWNMPDKASARAAALIAELAGGTVAPGAVDANPQPGQPRQITLRLERLERILGLAIDAVTAETILRALGCTTASEADTLQVTVPSFRPDLEREIDLVEEVGRIYGYDRVAERHRLSGPAPAQTAPALRAARHLRRQLTGLGLDEVTTNTIVAQTWLVMAGRDPDASPHLINPPVEAQAHMRADLVPSLLEVARRNFNRRAPAVTIFELGKCFRNDGEGLHVAGLLGGTATASSWQADRRSIDMLDLKGILQVMCQDFTADFRAAEHPLLRPGHAAQILSGDKVLGYWGQVRPALAAEFDLERPIYIFELDFEPLTALWLDRAASFTPLPKFPAIERDLALVVDEDTAAGDVITAIRAAHPLIEAAELFDVYRGDQLEAGRKSLACSVRLHSTERTLQDKEADAAIKRVLKHLQQTLGAQLR